MSEWAPSKKIAQRAIELAQQGARLERGGWEPCRPPKWLLSRGDNIVNGEGWQLTGAGGDGFAATDGTFRVIVSTMVRTDDADDSVWAHISVSRADDILPSWPDMMAMRDLWLGDDIEAYMIAPPADRYVNRHEGVLHWWARLAGPALPAMEARIVAADGRTLGEGTI